MAVAYVMEQGVTLNREGERLLVRKGTTTLHALHLFKLDQLVLIGNVSLTPPVVTCLLDSGVDTVLMSLNGRYKGRLQSPLSKNITLRCDQFRRLGDPSFCLDASRAIVAGKINNLRTALQRLNRSRETLELDDHILELKQLGKKAVEAGSMESLRGIEGRAAVRYFDGFARGFLVEGVTFTRRARRPPTDPVNALLSLGYTLLFNTVMAAVSLVGFDPYLGCLHTVDYGRPSLPLDLMEEWRPVIVDSLVLSVFNLKVITVEDFILTPPSAHEVDEAMEDPLAEDVEDEAEDANVPKKAAARLPVRLTDPGYRKFITQFERKMGEKVRFHLTDQHYHYRDCIREQVRHFARYVRGEDTAYNPMPWR